MLQITDKVNCCGCGGCAQICPKKCITMSEDSEGFLYPELNETDCVNCGACERVCPVNTSCNTACEMLQCYVAYANDISVRMQSSSGGIFTLLAEFVIDKGGVVFGAAFDKDFMVSHIAVDNNMDLSRLRGSKYLQSRQENAFAETKKYLEAGRYVLYSGTACQIAGLKKYLNKSYENLYTVDVLCHGVPSPKLWKKYLNTQQRVYKSDLIQASFRNKESGWKTYSVSYIFANKAKYEKKAGEDSYIKIFLSDICLRPSCHSCRFKELDRPSDITIGDCWGIQNYMPDMDDDKGTSVVLIHSQKGKMIFDSINEKMNFKQAETESALPSSSDSRKSVAKHPNRNKFFKKLNKGASISELEKLTEISIFMRAENKIRKIIKKTIINR